MQIAPPPAWICPHDGAPLTARATTLTCSHGHSFDRAREGYVNLLPVGDKASLDPGDSKAMVAARQRLLASGAYAAIADALATHVIARLAAHMGSRPYTILDAGCGEGYYLAQLTRTLADDPGEAAVRFAGIDISKWAVRAAAKRGLAAGFAVASNRRPPLASASVDLVLCIFGFPIWPGFAAIQPSGGEVLMIDPGPDHLLELRAIIYPEVQRRERAAIPATDGYSQTAEHHVTARTHIATPALIADLLSMTPHAHRSTAAGQTALAARPSLDLTLDIVLRRFTRSAA